MAWDVFSLVPKTNIAMDLGWGGDRDKWPTMKIVEVVLCVYVSWGLYGGFAKIRDPYYSPLYSRIP